MLPSLYPSLPLPGDPRVLRPTDAAATAAFGLPTGGDGYTSGSDRDASLLACASLLSASGVAPATARAVNGDTPLHCLRPALPASVTSDASMLTPRTIAPVARSLLPLAQGSSLLAALAPSTVSVPSGARPALMTAAVETLVALGADPRAVNIHGESAVFSGVRANSAPLVIAATIAIKNTVDAGTGSEWSEAARAAVAAAVDSISQRHGRSALHEAAAAGHKDAVVALLAAGSGMIGVSLPVPLGSPLAYTSVANNADAASGSSAGSGTVVSITETTTTLVNADAAAAAAESALATEGETAADGPTTEDRARLQSYWDKVEASTLRPTTGAAGVTVSALGLSATFPAPAAVVANRNQTSPATVGAAKGDVPRADSRNTAPTAFTVVAQPTVSRRELARNKYLDPALAAERVAAFPTRTPLELAALSGSPATVWALVAAAVGPGKVIATHDAYHGSRDALLLHWGEGGDGGRASKDKTRAALAMAVAAEGKAVQRGASVV